MSAIDLALNNNLLVTVNMMVEYIVKYQNSYIFSNLITDNVVQMITKGITLSPLFRSDLVLHPINYNDWPEKSETEKDMLIPYNESKLTLRYKYPQIFKEIYDREEKEKQQILDGTYISTGKRVNKINFELNMLTNTKDYEGDTIIEAISNSEELEIFQVHAIMDLIDYKFDSFAYKIHRVGFTIHMIYIFFMMLYINEYYLGDVVKDDTGKIISAPVPGNFHLSFILACLIYPTLFDGNQMIKQRGEYLDDPWNYIDIVHISMGYFNIYCQKTYG